MNASRWPSDAYIDAVGVEIARMADVVRVVAPETPVPSCPQWTVAELVTHTGAIHRWAAQMVRDLAQERLDRSTLDLGLPGDPSGYADWLAAGAEPLVAALTAADPGAPMWAWGADQHARFWMRRMVHETVVHRVDAELGAGREPHVDAALAADGIDELLENLPSAVSFRPRVAELQGSGEAIALQSTDGDAHWLVRLGAGGFTWERAVSADAAVAVAARTEDLLLLVYARLELTPDRFGVSGDGRVLDHWLERSAL
jgi:uncharacterized protein (TIGR03083 family)